MSPASKSKSKDKSAAKVVKEQPKASSKPSAAPVNGGSGVAANAYNPVSGTFHALETAPSTAVSTPQSNGRFRTMIDETEEHPGSLLDTTAEYDSVSNNDSCSGESEDQQKDKNNAANSVLRTDPVPGSDADKREKIRLKNEKKHQRQKERRAQELHERCCSYLTSRKLESLAQKLVAMGFTSEKATMALIHNEGRVEESALWLLERGEESKQQAAPNAEGVNNPKIDIADELARITELELIFKCSKQEVERAVVTCEGDLEKVEEALKAQRQEISPAANQKLEEPGDQPTVSANGFHNNVNNRLAAASSQNSYLITSVKGIAPPSNRLQRRDERDFNYTKSPAVAAVSQVEAASRDLQQPLRKIQPTNKSDWIKAQAVAPSPDRRWPSTSSGPSTPYSLVSPLQVAAAQAKPENRFVTTTGGNEVKTNLHSQGTLREPIYVMQRPQYNGTRQNVNPASISLGTSPPSSAGWYPGGATANAMEMMKLANGGLGQKMQNMTFAGRSNPQQLYPQDQHHQQFLSSSMGSPYNMHGTPTRSSSSLSSLAVPSSLGLFTGWGSSGTSPPVDWNTRGSMPQCDYTSIDWSLDLTPMALPSSSIKGERLYDNSWHASYTTPTKVASSRSMVNGLQQDGGLMVDHHHHRHRPAGAPSAGSPEWTSPFAGKDMFRAPRQFVTSPSP